MNILQYTWTGPERLATAAKICAAAIRRLAETVSREPSRLQITEELEALPGWMLDDIGLRRTDIVLVVDAGRPDRQRVKTSKAIERAGVGTVVTTGTSASVE